MPNDNDTEMRQKADAAIEQIGKQMPYVVGYAPPELSQEDRGGDWKANSRKDSTRGPNRTGTASLDSVQVDATKDPYDFSDAIAITEQQTRQAVAQRLAGSDDPRTIQATVVTMLERLEKELLIGRAMAGDEPTDPDAAESALTVGLRKRVADLQAFKAELVKLATANPVPEPDVTTRLERIEEWLKGPVIDDHAA